MPRLTSWVFPVVVLFLLSNLMAQVQYYKKDKWELSLSAGFSSAGDRSSATPVEGQEEPRLVRLTYDSGFLVGFRITENFGERLGAELDYTYANQPLGFINLSPQIPVLDADHGTHTFNYALLVHLLPGEGNFTPFLAAGLGAVLYHVGGNSKEEALVLGVDLKDRWKLAGSFGGGVKYRLTDTVGIRFDARDVVTGVPDYGFPHEAPEIGAGTGPAFKPSGLIHNLQFSAGVLFYWGGF